MEPLHLYALSIRQPWAELLLPTPHAPTMPPKAIETRHWTPAQQAAARAHVGTWIALHASKKVAPNGLPALRTHRPAVACYYSLPRGALVAVARLQWADVLGPNHARACLCRIEPGRTFGLCLSHVLRLHTPVPCTGRLGWFAVSLPRDTPAYYPPHYGSGATTLAFALPYMEATPRC